MLRLICGKAGSGKTAAVINEINEAVKAQQGGRLLIVPEQYSHEAERELCRVCGDTLSLYAEVFSFTGLSRRVMSTCGGSAGKYLDKGGRLLCMALALNAVSSRLEVYSSAVRKPELQTMLLSAIDELKTACVSADELTAASALCPGELGRKLTDLALIFEAYEAVVANGHADPVDRLTVLARQISEGGIDKNTHVYIDGFIDFTMQEQRIIEELLRAGIDVTVCLTVDSMSGDNEIFELSRRAARKLRDSAKELGVEFIEETSSYSGGKSAQLRAFADNMFSYSAMSLQNGGCIELSAAESLTAECEFAAAKAISLVRDTGCRWRDIGVAVRGFDDYGPTMESIFRHYNVPLFVARRSDIFEKPLPALISGAFEIINGGWEVDDVVSYMRTGLTGLDTAECDELESYIYKWQLRAGAWLRDTDWQQHPDGYNLDFTDEVKERLSRINALRRRLAEPLLTLRTRSIEASTASGQVEALAAYFEALKLPELLSARSAALSAAGRETQAKEYTQLWNIISSALEQCWELLGESESDGESFGKLFTMMLSKYDVGTIPVALDRVSAGDFDRMRRRSIKHLIVLGASDARLPKAESEGGIFSDDDRQRLIEADIDLGGAGEGELWREFSLIYNTLTLPSETLTMSYPLFGEEGHALRPAFVYNRAKMLFGIREEHSSLNECRMQAPAPALTVAAHALHGGGKLEKAAAEHFKRSDTARFGRLRAAAELTRGRLSPVAVEKLYGHRLRLSASRIDKFAACKFAYFCQYGLKAKPFEPADFTPPEIGTFSHAILENVARDVHNLGGFSKVSDEELKKLTDHYIQEYVHTELNDFREKTGRFMYLFNRLTHDVNQIVTDMAAELRKSDFEPMAFEFDFAKAGNIPPVELGDGENALRLTGIADRIDCWEHDGKLYVRVVDYKTGKKAFDLSNVYYGMGLQMLLYLFALEENGEKVFKKEIVPAGIMYVPARNNIVSLSSDKTDEEAESERIKSIKRSGIVLDDAEVLEAWENGGENLYIPVRIVRGKATEDSLASLERFGVLSQHIKKILSGMAAELKRGSIAADPYYRSQQENACSGCDYFNVCHFSNGENDESFRYLTKLKPDKAWALMEGVEDDE